ncbi:MAG TPA: HWE histidine kinase domain-containing protein [Beijerinckiaceae bacterium]|nr:HWE histidine kinase domain-containing protein [Beijerinckiaceae bacterium]
MTIRILLLEDSDLDAELIAGHLRRAELPHAITRVTSREDYVRALSDPHDLILADYVLPSFDGLAALELAREKAPQVPFIFVSGTLGEEIAIDSFKRGVTDYVLKQRLVRLPAAITRALAEAREKAERQQAEAHLRVLVAELSHRVNNTIAIIQAIATQTLRDARSLEDFSDSFVPRLVSLGKTHDLLTRTNWAGVQLRDVLNAELEPFQVCGDERCRFDGPDVELFPNAALTMALSFHELATNAAKYGALSHADGRLVVEWRLTNGDDSQKLHVTWKEVDGPPVSEPLRKGFGSRLINRSMHALGGQAEFDFAPDGLRCALVLPLEASPLDHLIPQGVHVHLSIRKTLSRTGS